MGTVDTKLTDAGKAVSLPDMHYRAGEIIGKKGGRRWPIPPPHLRRAPHFLFCILLLAGLSLRIPYLCSRNPFFDVYVRLKTYCRNRPSVGYSSDTTRTEKV